MRVACVGRVRYGRRVFGLRGTPLSGGLAVSGRFARWTRWWSQEPKKNKDKKRTGTIETGRGRIENSWASVERDKELARIVMPLSCILEKDNRYGQFGKVGEVCSTSITETIQRDSSAGPGQKHKKPLRRRGGVVVCLCVCGRRGTMTPRPAFH